MSQVSLEAIDYASDVERIMAEQIGFMRSQLEVCRREAVKGAHDVIRELYARLADKDLQIDALHEEVRFLRGRISAQSA